MIVAQNRLVGVDDDHGLGVSCTVDLTRAVGYGREKTYWLIRDFNSNGAYASAAELPEFQLPEEGAVLVLDAKRLAAKLDIRTVVWQNSDPPEERVMSNMESLSEYLVSIIVEEPAICSWLRVYDANVKLGDSEHTFSWAGDHLRETASALRSLKAHPRLRSIEAFQASLTTPGRPTLRL